MYIDGSACATEFTLCDCALYPLPTIGPQSRDEFFRHWEDILAEMERFDPDLILLSTGFDAHDDDPLSDVQLEDGDYRLITQKIVLAALKIGVKRSTSTVVDNADGSPSKPSSRVIVPIISVLEGGYDLQAIARSAVQHVDVLVHGAAGVVDLYYDGVGEEDQGFGGDEVAALQESLREMGLGEGRVEKDGVEGGLGSDVGEQGKDIGEKAGEGQDSTNK